MFDFSEIAGWIGAILVLLAYYFNSINVIKSSQLSYQALNISGAVFLIYYTYSCGALASMAVNVIWAIVGIISLGNSLKKNKISLKHEETL